MDDKKDKTEDKGWFEQLKSALSGSPQDLEQLVELLREAQSRQLVNADALSMMEGALQISERHAGDVMVPRGQMVMVPRSAPIGDVLKVIVDSGHSRFPVTEEDKDEVTGILLAKDLLHFFAGGAGKNFNIREYLRPAVFIPESKRLNTLLSEFRANRNHMAIVVDEYGATGGLVTIEDVLEQIVGDIDDEHDTDAEDNILKHDADIYTVRGITAIDEFNARFETDFSAADYDTVGGMLMHHLGRMPKKREETTIGRYRFKVLNTDNRRIYQLRVERIPPDMFDAGDEA